MALKFQSYIRLTPNGSPRWCSRLWNQGQSQYCCHISLLERLVFRLNLKMVTRLNIIGRQYWSLELYLPEITMKLPQIT